MSPFFALLGYNLKIRDYIENNLLKGEVFIIRERAERIIIKQRS
jgi:hypothetical protein